jgi:acetyl esterase/lipase
MPSPEIQNVINMLRTNRPDGEPPIPEARAMFENLSSLFPVAPDVAIEQVDAGGIPGQWITPPGVDADRVLFYLHGGGYTVGSVNTHRSMIAELARAAGVRALGIDYRLAPEHPHPAAIQDACSAYRWLVNSGVDASRVAIAGDSAGGGLTFATLISLRDTGDTLPACAVTISPWTDLEGTGESRTTRAEADPMIDGTRIGEHGRYYAPDGDLRAPTVSPLYADLSGLPPTLIQVGDAEVLLDDSTRIAARLEEAGVDVTLEVADEMVHVWHFFHAVAPEAKAAIEGAGAFIRKHLGS